MPYKIESIKINFFLKKKGSFISPKKYGIPKFMEKEYKYNKMVVALWGWP